MGWEVAEPQSGQIPNCEKASELFKQRCLAAGRKRTSLVYISSARLGPQGNLCLPKARGRMCLCACVNQACTAFSSGSESRRDRTGTRRSISLRADGTQPSLSAFTLHPCKAVWGTGAPAACRDSC